MPLTTSVFVLLVSGTASSLRDPSLIKPNRRFLDHFPPQSVLFYCDEGATFVERSHVCDGKIDCPDGRDEMLGICNGTNHCSKGEFKCLNDGVGAEIRCVRLDFTCDGEYDCYDGSDETHCVSPNCDGFVCENGYCAASNSPCDGFPDCHDHSDENKTMCALRNCGHKEFRCDSGQCVSLRGMCDGVQSCADGSDESSVLCHYGSRSLHCADQRRFMCAPGTCLQMNWLCDATDRFHCQQNGSRSLHCADQRRFMCAPGTCLQMNWLCDATDRFHCQQSELKLFNYTDRHSTTSSTTTTSTTSNPEVLANVLEDLTDYELNKFDYRDFSFSSSEDDV